MLVRAILLPVFVEVALIFGILFWMADLRRRAFGSGGLRAEDIALGQPRWPERATQVANCFGNQFEMPMLFFVLVAFLIETRHADLIMVILAWVFVLLRFGHAFVHTTTNNVMVRGPIYGLGAVVLLIMWIIFAVDVILLYKARSASAEERAMPLDFCHPQAPHKKLRLPEWYVSSLMMDRALDAIVRRVKDLDRKHDIPYLAGYSRNGKIIYIDRHMPPSFKYRGRTIDTDRFLILHEEVEKTLIDQLNLHYLHAHQIATRAEQAAVRAAGVSWRSYDAFMQKYVKHIGDERLKKVPADLDLKPYRDEHDEDLLRRMMTAVEKGEVPRVIGRERVRQAVARTLARSEAKDAGQATPARPGTARKQPTKKLAKKAARKPAKKRAA